MFFRHTLARIERKIGEIMATVAQIQADVAAEDTQIASAITLLTGLAAALKAAGTDPVALDALHADIVAQTNSLAQAVVTNTPPAPAA